MEATDERERPELCVARATPLDLWHVTRRLQDEFRQRAESDLERFHRYVDGAYEQAPDCFWTDLVAIHGTFADVWVCFDEARVRQMLDGSLFDAARWPVMGFSLTRSMSDVDGERGVRVDMLEVWPEYRRQGVGTALVRHAEEHAQALGHTAASAVPLEGAKPFWKALHYQPHPTLPRAWRKQLARMPMLDLEHGRKNKTVAQLTPAALWKPRRSQRKRKLTSVLDL